MTAIIDFPWIAIHHAGNINCRLTKNGALCLAEPAANA
jgi:hypothetical protein